MAFMVAQTVAVAARGGETAGGGDQGTQHGPPGGVAPEMIPLLEPRAMMEDTKGLSIILSEDPELRLVRFDAARAAAWLNAVTHERPEKEDEANAWLDQVAADFAADDANRPVVEGLRDHLLEAAPRWADRPADLRYLAAGVLFATMVETDPGTNPLTAMLFRLSLSEAFEEADERDRLLDSLGVDIGHATKACAAGEDVLPEGFDDAFERMPNKDQEKLRDLAEKQIDELRQQILAKDCQARLPIPCVIEPVLAMLELFRQLDTLEADDERREDMIKRIHALVTESAREKLHAEDRRLFVEICEHWLATEASEYPKQEPLMRTLRQFGVSDSLGTVEDALVLATLSRFQLPAVPGAPRIHFDSLEVDGGELERYGDFLGQRGYPTLALRMYRASRASKPQSPALEAKIADLKKELGRGGQAGT